LSEVRGSVPDAAGLVIATDHYAARAYAEILREVSGQPPTIVLSDEKAATDRIAQFARGTSRWMVAVRMVSEGVDIPRLGVGVYATSAATPLYFAQAVGRFVRTRRRGETASIFLPSVPSLMSLAGQLELERDHALDREAAPGLEEILLDDDAIDEANRSESASADADLFDFKAIEAQANFDRVLYEGTEFGFAAEVGTPEELDFIGIPGLLEPDQVRELLKQRQARQSRRSKTHGEQEPKPLYRTLKEQRTLLNSLVAMQAKRSGEPHAHIHAELRRRAGGPPVPQASVAQLQARIDLLRRG
jgi:DNA or RNA helicases of superfamily II